MSIVTTILSKFDSKDWRDKVEFLVKVIGVIVGGIWIVCVGTDLIDRQQKALNLRNMALGNHSIPVADTALSWNTNNQMWTDNVHCTVTGQYTIKNTGNLIINIDVVKFSIFELPLIYDNSQLNGQRVTSISVSNRIEGVDPIFQEEIAVNENIGLQNEIQRSFGFIIRKQDAVQYVVVASATGGVSSERDENILSQFQGNDLTHISPLAEICPKS